VSSRASSEADELELGSCRERLGDVSAIERPAQAHVSRALSGHERMFAYRGSPLRIRANGDPRRPRKLDRTRPIDAAVALALAMQGATIEQPGSVYDTAV
jgi:hypothetical protein